MGGSAEIAASHLRDESILLGDIVNRDFQDVLVTLMIDASCMGFGRHHSSPVSPPPKFNLGESRMAREPAIQQAKRHSHLITQFSLA
jgi:hypothetical protein